MRHSLSPALLCSRLLSPRIAGHLCLPHSTPAPTTAQAHQRTRPTPIEGPGQVGGTSTSACLGDSPRALALSNCRRPRDREGYAGFPSEDVVQLVPPCRREPLDPPPCARLALLELAGNG